MYRIRLFAIAGLALVGLTFGTAEAGWPPLHHRPVIVPGPVVVSAAVAVPVPVVIPEPVVVAAPPVFVAAAPVVVTAPIVVRPIARPGIVVAPRVIIR
jgi:hypothetical protein